MSERIEPCEGCGGKPDVSQMNPYAPNETHIYCPNCYDGAPDSGPQNTGYGRDRGEAVEDWNANQEDRRDL